MTPANLQQALTRTVQVAGLLVLWSSGHPQTRQLVDTVARVAARQEGRVLVLTADLTGHPELLQAFQPILVQAFGQATVPATFGLLQGQPVPLFPGIADEQQVGAGASTSSSRPRSRTASPGGSTSAPVPGAEGEEDSDELPPLHQEAYDAIERGDLAAAAAAYEQALAAGRQRDEDARLGLAQVRLMERTAGRRPHRSPRGRGGRPRGRRRGGRRRRPRRPRRSRRGRLHPAARPGPDDRPATSATAPAPTCSSSSRRRQPGRAGPQGPHRPHERPLLTVAPTLVDDRVRFRFAPGDPAVHRGRRSTATPSWPVPRASASTDDGWVLDLPRPALDRIEYRFTVHRGTQHRDRARPGQPAARCATAFGAPVGARAARVRGAVVARARRSSRGGWTPCTSKGRRPTTCRSACGHPSTSPPTSARAAAPRPRRPRVRPARLGDPLLGGARRGRRAAAAPGGAGPPRAARRLVLRARPSTCGPSRRPGSTGSARGTRWSVPWSSWVPASGGSPRCCSGCSRRPRVGGVVRAVRLVLPGAPRPLRERLPLLRADLAHACSRSSTCATPSTRSSSG